MVRTTKSVAKENKCFFQELPHYNVNDLIGFHGQFNNLLLANNGRLPTKRYLEKLRSLYDLDIFSLNVRQTNDINPDIQCNNLITANYYYY